MENNRIFCIKCGTENEKSSNFCKKCGASLCYVPSNNKSSLAWYLLPILFSIFGGIIGYFIFRNKDKTKAKNLLYVGLGIFLLPIISAIISSFIFGLSPENNSTNQTPEPIISSTTKTTLPIITKTPSDIGLTIDDLPVGWSGSGRGNETKYSSSFIRGEFGNSHLLECHVTKYSTIEDAKQSFYKLKKEYSDFKLISVGLGDESFGWEFGTESNVIFRRANIIVDIFYVKQIGSSSVRDAKKYAEIVEKKIKNNQ